MDVPGSVKSPSSALDIRALVYCKETRKKKLDFTHVECSEASLHEAEQTQHLILERSRRPGSSGPVMDANWRSLFGRHVSRHIWAGGWLKEQKELQRSEFYLKKTKKQSLSKCWYLLNKQWGVFRVCGSSNTLGVFGRWLCRDIKWNTNGLCQPNTTTVKMKYVVDIPEEQTRPAGLHSVWRPWRSCPHRQGIPDH